MKDYVKKLKSFITFDFPTQFSFISSQFECLHIRQRVEIPQWAVNATYKKMIADYWFSHVLRHFASFMILSLIVVSPFHKLDTTYGVIWLMVSIAVFPVFLLFNYWPDFYGNFLPKLETVKESYQKKDFEQIEKCKRAQMSNMALSLIYYVLDKTSNINALQTNDRFAISMMRLYGKDSGSIKRNMVLIAGAPNSVKSLSQREKTEIRNRFNEAYDFLDQLPFPEGIKVLKALEVRFQN